jgi:hypothetical protein
MYSCILCQIRFISFKRARYRCICGESYQIYEFKGHWPAQLVLVPVDNCWSPLGSDHVGCCEVGGTFSPLTKDMLRLNTATLYSWLTAALHRLPALQSLVVKVSRGGNNSEPMPSSNNYQFRIKLFKNVVRRRRDPLCGCEMRVR